MKRALKIALLALVVIGTSNRCYALRLIQGVSDGKRAQELGVKIRSELVATNHFGVWLEFSPQGKLAHFGHGELEVASAGRQFVCATLLPLHQTSDKVVLYFSVDRDYLQSSILTIIVSGARGPDPDGYSFAIKDFVN